MLSNEGRACTCNIERQKIEIDLMAVLADSIDKKKWFSLDITVPCVYFTA
jgi:hypothetical protein